jgi:hypothetical protein
MPVYVPHYQHDIFVSYAHVDNEPLAGADKGWVTTLITGLKKQLGAKLGRADAYSLWMDYKLSGNQPVTPDIEAQLKSTATFLLILSPGYFASPWCLLEFNTFLQQVGPGSRRIFMVEKDFIERENKLPELRELLGYPFWVRSEETGKIRTLGVPRPNPDREPEYYQQLDELATELANSLNRLKTQTMMESKSSDLDQSSALQRRLKKTRLQNEKARLEAKRDKLIQEYEILATKLTTTVDAANRAILNNQLRQYEQDAEQVEQEIAKIDRELGG